MHRRTLVIFTIILAFQFSGCTSIYKYMKNKRDRTYREGLVLYRQKKYSKAHDKFAVVVSIDPGYARAKVYLRRTEIYMKRKERRIQKRVNAQYITGMRYRRSGKYEAALRYFLIVSRQDPYYEDVDDQIDECREKLQRRFRYLLKAAEYRYQRKEYKKAYAISERALRISPNDQELLTLMDEIRGGLNDKSRKYRNYANKLYKRKQYKKAKEQCRRALAINPWDNKAKELSADCNRMIAIDRDYMDAVKYYSKKKYFVSRKMFASIQRREEGYRKTKIYIERIDTHIKKNIWKYYNKGVWYYDRDRFKEAVREFNRVLSYSPGYKNAEQYRQRALDKLATKKSLEGN